VPRFLIAFVLAGLAAACVPPPPPVADLVPAAALTAVLPDSVGLYGAAGDEVYRGYFADSTGALALVTVARTYRRGQFLMTLNVSSMDDPGRYRAVVEDGGGRPVADSIAQAIPMLRAAAEAGWQLYAVQYGWLLFHPDGRVVEAKSLLREVAAEALGAVDLARLSALAEEPTTVDTAFVRVISRGLAPRPRPVERDGDVLG
jgi:hypothetical protein